MKRLLLSLVALTATMAAPVSQAQPVRWVAGKHYTVIPPQRTQVPAGKIEVMEVFSYGCPACNTFRPVMKQLQTTLPKNAQLVYLPASWNKAENWPLLQRAYLTALTLGIADRTHEAMYEAIWTTGELGIVEPGTQRLKTQLPSMEDTAKFYQRVAGVKAQDFINASKSYGVDLKIRQAEKQIKDMGVLSTPTLVVNGKYRINNDQMRTTEMVELVQFLVARESAAAAAAKPVAAPAKPAAASAQPAQPAKPAAKP
jgi:thiol:disulfide interchange protein DsbA